MKKTAILTALCMCVSVFSASAYAQDNKRTYVYVSADGSDNGTGEKDSPFKTLEKARDYLREHPELKENGATVYLRGGEYSILNTIEFNEQDGGTEENPVIYKAYPGEKVDFVGSLSINSEDFKKLADEDMIKRAASSEAASHIVEYNVFDLGITEIPEPNLPGAYSYWSMMKYIHGKQAGEGAPELFINEKAMTIARYPNGDEMNYVKQVINPGEVVGDYDESSNNYIPPEKRTKEPFTFVPRSGNIAKWAMADQAILYGRWKYDWADQAIPIKSIDVEKGTITPLYPSYFGVTTDRPFYIYNLFEEIDMPGEYFLDRYTGKLYLYPPEGATKYKAYLSFLAGSMINIENVSNMKFSNINMKYMKNGAVYIDNCKNVVIDGGEFAFTATVKAITINASNDCGIKNAYFHDTDGGVIIDGGDFETLTHGNNYVENCVFKRFARITKGYNYAITLSGVGNRAAYNEISEAEHCGLSFGGNEHIIEYNEFYNCCQTADDMGALYSGRDTTCRGTIIRYNYFHDIKSSSPTVLGVHGVYLDDGFSGGIVVGNIFENISGFGMHLTGRDAYVKNNIFINIGNAAVYMDYRDATSDGSLGVQLWARLNAKPWQNELWTEKYPEIAEGIEHFNSTDFNQNNIIDSNVLVNSPGIKTHAKVPKDWGEFTNNYSTESDPGFYDFKNRNYTLKESSVVFDKISGFVALPFTRMGTYSDRAKNRVKDALVLAIDSPRALKNGEITRIDESDESVVPVIINNSTYMPIRFLSEGMGGQVEWNEEERCAEVVLGQNKIDIFVEKGEIYKNEELCQGDWDIRIINGRTFIPLRTIGEALGREVYWNDIGMVCVSGTEALFDDNVDESIINYLYGLIAKN